jgi:hypothetical protein
VGAADTLHLGRLTSLEDGLNWFAEFPDFDLPDAVLKLS